MARREKTVFKRRIYAIRRKKGYGIGWKANANALLNRMKTGDLVWFRDTKGSYYLGRNTGDWEYRDNEENLQTDIINIRPVELYPVGMRIVGKIINSFNRARTVQQILNNTALIFSKIVYNKLSGYNYYKVNKEISLDIFSLFSPEELEDVVGLYLELERGYFIIPSSRGRRDNTIKYEFELFNKNNEKAFVQVKEGEKINPDDYKESDGKYFLFSPMGYKYETKSDKLETLSKTTIEQFLKKYQKILPLNIKEWLDFVEEQRSKGGSVNQM